MATSTLQPSSVDFRARQRAVILAFGRRGVGQSDAVALMRDAAALVAETLQASHSAAIELLDGQKLRLHMAKHSAADRAGGVHLYPAGPVESMAAHAIERRRPIVSNNLLQETVYKDLFLRNLGVTSAVTTPLCVDDQVLGALGVYSTQHREFTSDDVEFAETIGHLLASSLGRLKAEQTLRVAQGALNTLMQSADSLIVVTDVSGRILRINRACEKLTGYASDEIRGRPLCSVFTPPGEVEMVLAMFKQSAEGQGPLNYESSILTKLGELKRARWSQATMLGESGSPQSILLSGIENSEPKHLTDELRQTRESRDKLQQALDVLLRKLEPAAEIGHLPERPFHRVADEQFSVMRASPRRAYPYHQAVAPLLDGKLPSAADFFSVQFQDISAGGVSFLLGYRPQFDMVVLGLGFAPNLRYVTAKILNVNEVGDSTHAAAAGETMFLVGCKFLERVHQ